MTSEEILLLISNKTETFREQTKTIDQQTLEFKNLMSFCFDNPLSVQHDVASKR